MIFYRVRAGRVVPAFGGTTPRRRGSPPRRHNGIMPEPRDNHAAYIASWLAVLKNNKRARSAVCRDRNSFGQETAVQHLSGVSVKSCARCPAANHMDVVEHSVKVI